MLPCVLILPVLLVQAPTAPDLSSLAWLQGRWIATKGAETVEEQWSLQGTSLLGVSRTLVGGQSRGVELLMLEKQGPDLVLRLRMFGPALDKAGRGKEEPLRLKLVEADATHFRCEGIGPEAGTVLIYERKGADGLQAHISKTREGKVVWEERFSFQRAR